MQDKVLKTEQDLAKYAEDNELIAFSKEQSVVVSELNDLTKLLVAATAKRINSESLYNQLKEGLNTSSTSLDDDSIRKLRVDLKEAEAEYADLGEKVTPRYPRMIELKAKIDRLKVDIEEQRLQAFRALEAQYKSDLRAESVLIERIDSQKSRVHETSKRSVQYNIMQREYESLKDLYQTVLRQLKESQVSSASSGSNVSIVDYAVLPDKPSRPQKTLSLVMAVAFGLMIGVAAVFGLEFFDRTLTTPEDAREQLGLPLIGFVPVFGEQAPSVKGPIHLISNGEPTREGSSEQEPDGGEDDGVSETELEEPMYGLNKTLPRVEEDEVLSVLPKAISGERLQKMAASESFRTIRTNILLSSADAPRIMMITSSKKGEGKTTLASNLAIAFAQASYRTLLIDADVRRPCVGKRFNLSGKRGLVDFLTNQSDFDELVCATSVSNLSVVTAGSATPNPSELIGSKRMAELVAILAKEFDYVLIDAPPVLPVADSLILSNLVDRVLFVVRSNETDKYLAREAVDRLKQVRASLLGVVMNDVDLRSYGRGSSYNYYSAYYMVNEDHRMGGEQFRRAADA